MLGWLSDKGGKLLSENQIEQNPIGFVFASFGYIPLIKLVGLIM